LRRALERNELELFYQPQVNVSGTLEGMEALLRWRHPQRGLLAPGEFIHIAEETGLIVPIGTWVLEQACRQCLEWQTPGQKLVKVAVNVSMLQFYFSDLVEVVRSVLSRTGLDPRCLELELTETLVMRNSEESTEALTRIRELGVSVAIDDFGTGYSSLSYLQRLPVDLLKIDRSFFTNIDAGSTAAVIQAITMLAHSLGLRVVAEGIETEKQLEAVRKVGIDYAQGYLIGRPLPADAAREVIEDLSEKQEAAA
jgi:EAL domain-containing protein (putative c-di-GMP-specific phosphodiesterase class I)